jgi:hypothetical protein
VLDSPMLSDGKNPTFNSWLIKIEHKLRTNAHHFNSSEDEVAYVFSRTEGRAKEHSEPKMSRRDRFRKETDTLDYLADIYIDPHRERNPRREYRELEWRRNRSMNSWPSSANWPCEPTSRNSHGGTTWLLSCHGAYKIVCSRFKLRSTCSRNW